MGYKTPTKKWAKGVSGNPGGRPKVSKELAHVPLFREVDAKHIFSKYLKMEHEKLIDARKDDSLSGFEMIVVSAILNSVRQGDYSKVAPIIERLFGKVKENVDISVNDRPMEKVTAEDISKILSAPVIDVTPDEAEIVFDTDYGPMKPKSG